MVCRGSGGDRTIKAADFFVDILTTAPAEDEIVTQVRLPPPPDRSAYLKFDHPASHYALTGVAAVVAVGDDGKIQRVRIGITGVGPKAYRAESVEHALQGKGVDAVSDASSTAADGIDCNDDIHASASTERTWRGSSRAEPSRRPSSESKRRFGPEADGRDPSAPSASALGAGPARNNSLDRPSTEALPSSVIA